MGMDAARILGQLAARERQHLEKSAAPNFGAMVPKAMQWAQKLMPAARQMVSRGLPTARNLAGKAALGYGGMAGLGAAHAALTDNPGGADSLAWHRQKALGYGHGVTGEGVLPAIQRFGYGAATSLGNPGRTLMSMFAGPAAPSVMSGPSFSGGHFDPATGQETGTYTARRILSPYAQDTQTNYNAARSQYDTMRRQQVGALHNAQNDLASGNYGGGWGMSPYGGAGTVNDQRREQESLIEELRSRLGSGEYGGGVFSPNASYYRHRTDQLGDELQQLGLMGEQPAQQQPAAAANDQLLGDNYGYLRNINAQRGGY